MENNSGTLDNQNNSSTIDEMNNHDENSQIVNEILTEMNNDQTQSMNSMNNDDQYTHDQNEQLNRQMDPTVNMNAMDQLNMIPQEESNENNNKREVDMTVTMTKEESLPTKILSVLKKPMIVILAVFIMFSPITSGIFKKYLPKIFTNQTVSTQYLALLLKSVLTGVLFFSTETLLK